MRDKLKYDPKSSFLSDILYINLKVRKERIFYYGQKIKDQTKD